MPGGPGDFSSWEVREVRRSERRKVSARRNLEENRLSGIALRTPAMAGVQQANPRALELYRKFHKGQ